MKSIRVPKSFELFGQKITVKFSKKAFKKQKEYIGWAVFKENKIILRKPSPDYPLNCNQIESVFIHEMVHFIMLHAGPSLSTPLKNKGDLHTDEGFVNTVAHLLHQALSTAKGNVFEEEPKS